MRFLIKLANYITGTKTWAFFTKKVISQLDMRIFGDSKFPMEKWYEVEEICKQNSEKLLVFVSFGTKLSSILVRLVSRSRWTHAGVIRVVGDKIRIVHMESEGLLDEVFLELIKTVDNLAIIAIPLETYEKALAYGIMEKFIAQKPGYDFQMLLGNKALYCSELIYEMCKPFSLIRPHEEVGREVFEPQDVYNMGEVLFEHRT